MSFRIDSLHALKADQDGNGNNIADTYIKDLSVTGATITITKGDNTASDVSITTGTTYTASGGLKLENNTFKHSNNVDGKTVGPSSDTSGTSINIPYIKYDDYGHITAESGTHTYTVDGFLPLSGGTLTGTVSGTGTWLDNLQDLTSSSIMSNTTIDFSKGAYVKFTVGAAITLTFEAGGKCRMGTLEFTNSNGYKITWKNVKWADGEEPDLDTAGGVNLVTLVTSDGGTTWYGMVSGKSFAVVS